jgi:thioredoxin
VIDTTDTSFEQDVLESAVPVLVEFTAPWCRPCRAIEPHLHALEEEYAGRLRVVRIDIDANLGVPSRYGVLSLPTVIVFARGEPSETIHGPQPRRRYEEAAARALAGTAP